MRFRKPSKLTVTCLLSLSLCLGSGYMGAYGAPLPAGPLEVQDGGGSLNQGKASSTPDIEPGGSIDGKSLYLIYTEAGLRSIGTGEYGMDQAYMLASSSIDLSDKEWTPIGTADHPFTGYFDGNGCDIKGLTMTSPDAALVGLFGYAENATIHNVTLTELNIASAGTSNPAKQENPICAVSKNCTISDISVDGKDYQTPSSQSAQMKTTVIDGTTWYMVENEAQLRSIGTGKYGLDQNYLQSANIAMSPTEWIPIGTKAAPFKGQYNGNGFEITGLTMKDPNAKIVGMFGAADSATISNVTLRNSDISSAGKNARDVVRGAVVAWGEGNNRISNNKVYSD